MFVRIIRSCRNSIFRIWLRQHINIGNNSFIVKPLRIKGSGIKIKTNVIIQEGCWIECNPLTDETNPELRLEDGCIIGHFNEIYATKSIILEKNVLTADRVYISDNLHEYKNPNIPILEQPIRQIRTVCIGEGSWLGVGVAVIGANIGKHCVIGANAVVTHDIPDFSVAVGIPAKVIKRYNPDSNKWERTNPDGSFIENRNTKI